MIETSNIGKTSPAMLLLDIDGTLLVGNQMSGRVHASLVDARSADIALVIATGRSFSMLPEQLKHGLFDGFICCNGAVVYDAAGVPVMERPLQRDIALTIMDLLEPLNPAWNAFLPHGTSQGALFEWGCFSYQLANEGGQPEEPTPDSGALPRRVLHSLSSLSNGSRIVARRLWDDRNTTQRVRSIKPFVRELDTGIYKLGCTLPSHASQVEATRLLEDLPGIEIACVTPTELEVTAAGATKGTAARWIERQMAVARPRVTSIGDSENDLPLKEASGRFVAMGNAPESIRETADEVCEPVWEDGVARWIERALGNG